MRNPKSEIRSPKQTRTPKSEPAPGAPASSRLCGVVAGKAVSRPRVSALTRRLLCFCFLLSAFCILHSAFCLRAWGQDYAIDWYTIDGGGGESTDGYYLVTGTIGQPDAGELTDGYYAIVGGFWAVGAAVPAPGAPGLTIHRTSTNAVVVSWPAPAPNWVLQEGWNVLGGPWFTIIPPLAESAGRLRAILPKAAGYKFYRLKQMAGLPVLLVQRAGTNTLVTWPGPAPGWVLEQCSPADGSRWTLPNAPCAQVGGQMQVVLPAAAYDDFYRLALAPALSITRGPTNTIVVSWFATALGWVLQECPMLSSNTWSTVTTAPVQSGVETRVTLAGTGSGRFFRLAQASPAPRLSITFNPQLSTIIVSWPWPAEGWVLECTNALPQMASPWPQIPPPYQTNGANLQFMEPAPTGNKFYRLHKP
jgi:hypothetical protein